MVKDISQAKRGMSFETRIENTNKFYQSEELAVIQKIPTPTKNIRGKIVYSAKSTVDFIGSLHDGESIAFEAKETATETSFPLTKRYKGKDVETILEHQRDFLFKWPGIGFVLIHFSEREECYRVPVAFIEEYYQKMYKGGRKSIPINDFWDEWKVDPENYLDL